MEMGINFAGIRGHMDVLEEEQKTARELKEMLSLYSGEETLFSSPETDKFRRLAAQAERIERSIQNRRVFWRIWCVIFNS